MQISGSTAAAYMFSTIGNLTQEIESYGTMLNPTNFTETYQPSVSCAAGTRTLPHAALSTG
jgi:hypothetical protein